jgi:hypothetical protein
VRNRALQLAFWWLVDWLDAIEADYQAASVEMEALQFALAFPRHIGPGQFGWAVVHEGMQREHHQSRLRQLEVWQVRVGRRADRILWCVICFQRVNRAMSAEVVWE